MKREFTISEKVRFLFQYLDIAMFIDSIGRRDILNVGNLTYMREGVVAGHVELRPISDMTSDHANEIAKLYYTRAGIKFDRHNLIDIEIHRGVGYKDLNAVFLKFTYNHSWGIEVSDLFLRDSKKTDNYIVDKLRELGYAFSWNSMTVENQVCLGWVKLIKE